MERISRWIVKNRLAWVLVWWVLFVAALPMAPRLAPLLKGGADPVAGTPSARAAEAMQAKFGKGFGNVIPVVLDAPKLAPEALPQAAARLALKLSAVPQVRQVLDAWNAGIPALAGKDGHTALLLVTPRVDGFSDTEGVIQGLRQAAAQAGLPPSCSVDVTGMVAAFQELNRTSAEDTFRAERWGIPCTLLILFAVFGSPMAASLPLVLALAASVMGTAGLYLLSPHLDITVFAQNAVTMIGLGVGVDYALIIVSRFRAERLGGLFPLEAAVQALRHGGPSVAGSGLTVALGFAALMLVPVPFLHAISAGGMVVVLVAVSASLTLLPSLLALGGAWLDWPRKGLKPSALRLSLANGWERWAQWVMRHPWRVLIPSLLVLGALIAPSSRMKTIGMGAGDLQKGMEARRGSDLLAADFSPGWMGPLALVIEAKPGQDVFSPAAREAVLDAAQGLGRDPRVDLVLGYSSVLKAAAAAPLPPALAARALADVVSPDRRMAILWVIPKGSPESAGTRGLVQDLRKEDWPALRAAGLGLGITGSPALLLDFDTTLFTSLWTLVPLVLLATFIVLALLFKSLLIPLKAVLLNLSSVLAAYGFLVLVFQDGLLASSLGVKPTGGLDSFIVVMLFTILFGLSMDYEIFLLMAIREAHLKGVDDAQAVATGLAKTAGLITSAALIMVCLFGSFTLTRLGATRTFGLGLAFAVGLDASLIRLALVPALMELFGAANWWFPGQKQRA